MTKPVLRLHEFGGAGPVLVVGPSLGTGVRNLWGICADSLRGDRRVIGWDLLGHAGAPPAVGFELPELAVALLDALAEVGVDSEFDYAGNSIGGALGLHLLLHPSRPVRSAVLSCTGARIGTPQIWQDRAGTVRAGGLTQIVEGAAGRWFAPGFQVREPDVAAALLSDLAGVHPESYAATCESLAGHDLRERLVEIAVPVLAVAGAQDQPAPVSLLRAIAEGVPDGRLAILDGVAHLAPVEAPDRLAELVTDHLSGRHLDRAGTGD